MLSFFPLDVLDEIWDLIESVSGGFLTYSYFSLDTPQLKNLNLFFSETVGLFETKFHMRAYGRM